MFECRDVRPEEPEEGRQWPPASQWPLSASPKHWPSLQSTDHHPCDPHHHHNQCRKVKVIAGDWVSPPSSLEWRSSSPWEWSLSSILTNLLPRVTVQISSVLISQSPSQEWCTAANLFRLKSRGKWISVRKTRWKFSIPAPRSSD